MDGSFHLHLHRAGNAVRILPVAFALLGGAALSTATAQAPTQILSAYAGQNETVGPMWVGIAKGTFKKYGLDVRMVQLRNGSLSMATLATGQVQYNYGSPGERAQRFRGRHAHSMRRLAGT